MNNNKYRSTCAIAMSVDLFGDKWSLLILRDMLLHKKATFKEFSNSKEKIATNILTSRLVHLIEFGYVAKSDSNYYNWKSKNCFAEIGINKSNCE